MVVCYSCKIQPICKAYSDFLDAALSRRKIMGAGYEEIEKAQEQLAEGCIYFTPIE